MEGEVGACLPFDNWAFCDSLMHLRNGRCRPAPPFSRGLWPRPDALQALSAIPTTMACRGYRYFAPANVGFDPHLPIRLLYYCIYQGFSRSGTVG